MGFNQLRIATQGVPQGIFTKNDKTPLVVAVLALALLAAPFDEMQLACALIGALVYYIYSNPMLGRPQDKPMKIKAKMEIPDDSPSRGARTPSTRPPARSEHFTSPAVASSAKPTAMPIKAPTFAASEFDQQINELIGRITPTPSCHRAVEELTSVVRQKIQTLIPEAEVMGFATGDLRGGTAYGVAVPEVDIVANACPTDLTTRLQGRLSQMSSSRQRTFAVSRLDTRKLQKSAIRVCTSLLVSVGFKFRRSSFRSEEPKVTLLAPASLGASTVAIPIDFSINNTTPLYNMALLTECGQMDPRAKSLILLVKRWAKDRGVCHASKGHLPPYAWSLLTIYFLQAGVVEADGGLPLPALDAFAVSSGLMTAKGDGQSPSKGTTSSGRPATAQKKTMSDLFRDFVRFYNRDFDWRKEAVSVRLGQRRPPNLSLDIHIVLNDDGTTAVSPIIEDPFDSKKNIGCCTNAASLQRFFEELDRADTLLARDTSLTELLDPWRPPEHANENQDKAEHAEDDEDD